MELCTLCFAVIEQSPIDENNNTTTLCQCTKVHVKNISMVRRLSTSIKKSIPNALNNNEKEMPNTRSSKVREIKKQIKAFVSKDTSRFCKKTKIDCQKDSGICDGLTEFNFQGDEDLVLEESNVTRSTGRKKYSRF